MEAEILGKVLRGGDAWWISTMEGDQRKTGDKASDQPWRDSGFYGLFPMDGSLLRSDGG